MAGEADAHSSQECKSSLSLRMDEWREDGGGRRGEEGPAAPMPAGVR